MAEDRPAGQRQSASAPLGGGALRARSPRPGPQAEDRQPQHAGESQPPQPGQPQYPGHRQPRQPGHPQPRHAGQPQPEHAAKSQLRYPTQRRPQSQSGRRLYTWDLPHQSLPHAQAQLGPLPRPAPETGTEMAAGVSAAVTGDDWDQEASLAAMVAQIEAGRAAGLIDPDDLDEDDGFLPFGDDGRMRISRGPAMTGPARARRSRSARPTSAHPSTRRWRKAAQYPSTRPWRRARRRRRINRRRRSWMLGSSPAAGPLAGPGLHRLRVDHLGPDGRRPGTLLFGPARPGRDRPMTGRVRGSRPGRCWTAPGRARCWPPPRMWPPGRAAATPGSVMMSWSGC